MKLRIIDLYEIITRYCYAEVVNYLGCDASYVIHSIYDEYADNENDVKALEYLLDKIYDLTQSKLTGLYETIEHEIQKIVNKAVTHIKLLKLKNTINKLEIEGGSDEKSG